MTTLLEAKALTKHYGNTIALESLDFEVQDGITGLLGPNGAGKSTASYSWGCSSLRLGPQK